MTKEKKEVKKMLDNKGAIAELEKQLADYKKDQMKLSAVSLKAEGAIEILSQIEEGVEIDTKSTNWFN